MNVVAQKFQMKQSKARKIIIIDLTAIMAGLMPGLKYSIAHLSTSYHLGYIPFIVCFTEMTTSNVFITKNSFSHGIAIMKLWGESFGIVTSAG